MRHDLPGDSDASLEQLRERDIFSPMAPGSAVALTIGGVLLLAGSVGMMWWLLSGGPHWAIAAILVGVLGVTTMLLGINQLLRRHAGPS